jgi:hypothetical protein
VRNNEYKRTKMSAVPSGSAHWEALVPLGAPTGSASESLFIKSEVISFFFSFVIGFFSGGFLSFFFRGSHAILQQAN